MSKLEDILQQEVTQEISALHADAESRAKSILDAAMQRAEALKAARQKALEAEAAAAIRRAESAGELVLNQARISARGQAVDQVKAEVLKALQNLSTQPTFGDTLRKLADEALKGIGKAESVVVNPAHATLIEPWAKANGLKLGTDPKVNYGVKLVAEGGRSQVQNTLTDRLERAWDSLSAKAAKAIWG
ncbi:MAG: V-type ATP synthase subunit E [Meiothermus sp.]